MDAMGSWAERFISRLKINWGALGKPLLRCF